MTKNKDHQNDYMPVHPGRSRTITKKSTSKWSDKDYNTLITYVRKHGEDWVEISKLIPHKTAK